jgi:outer membrane protein assembly factor BamB
MSSHLLGAFCGTRPFHTNASFSDGTSVRRPHAPTFSPLPTWFGAIAALCALALIGCGGGGGDSGGSGGGGGGGGGSGSQSMSLSASSLTDTASTVDPIPSDHVRVTIAGGLIGTTYYVQAAATSHAGIDTVTVGSESSQVDPTADIGVTFKPPGSLGVGVYNDSITIKACYDQACSRMMNNSPQTVTVKYTVVNPVATVGSLQPNSISAGSDAFTLTVFGTEFTTQSVVNWNGAARPTTYVSITQLTAQISAADIAAGGTRPVTVSNPGVASSAAANFTIQAVGLTSVTPSFVASGGPAFTLNLTGAGFASSSVVQWNGSARTTTFVSSTQLQAQVTSADIAAASSAAVTVLTPSATGGPSAPVSVTVAALPTWPAAAHSVAYQINPAHTGSVNFANVTFPTGKAWEVDLHGGAPSYAVIAEGKVFVTTTTVENSLNVSKLYALDQTTGAVAWGPITTPGFQSPAYDNGAVFVSTGVVPQGPPGSTPVLGNVTAYDAATGAQLWSTPMNGFDDRSTSAPTAMNGHVYVTGGDPTSTGGTYALDELTGAVSWSKTFLNGGDSSPAVNATGVYVDFPCGPRAYDPATGQELWPALTTCTGVLGATPMLVGNTVYEPGLNNVSGDIVDAATGAVAGQISGAFPQAFDGQTQYVIQPPPGVSGNTTLRAIALGSTTPKWSFSGDGNVCLAVSVGQYVIAAACSGKVYGVDANTGQQAWVTNDLGAQPNLGSTTRIPLGGMTAGDGIVVVPVGTKVIAYLLAKSP